MILDKIDRAEKTLRAQRITPKELQLSPEDYNSLLKTLGVETLRIYHGMVISIKPLNGKIRVI